MFERKSAPYLFHGQTVSLCDQCLAPVPAKIAIQLFHELFSSGKYVPEEKVELMDADWTPEQAEADRQLRLFDLDPQGELAPL